MKKKAIEDRQVKANFSLSPASLALLKQAKVDQGRSMSTILQRLIIDHLSPKAMSQSQPPARTPAVLPQRDMLPHVRKGVDRLIEISEFRRVNGDIISRVARTCRCMPNELGMAWDEYQRATR